ncbi:MAG: hypothetical protein CMO81_07730 [Waddliaceae bacterium]|nr:hypothetical protein [Waddliaceae bacterium]
MSSFYENLGLSEQSDLGKFFVDENCKSIEKLPNLIRSKMERVSHFLKSGGIWINHHNVGQELNASRFTVRGTKNDISSLESELNRNIYPGFTENAYREGMEESLSESIRFKLEFFEEFLKAPNTVGSLAPSSDVLAKAMVEEIPSKNKESEIARRCLEVGPGTGVFTYQLLKKLGEEDKLVLVEFDKKFVNILQKRFGHLENVTIESGDFAKYNEDEKEEKFDYCLSGLPLLAFSSDMVERMYQSFERNIKPSGKLIYFEYLGLPSVKQSIANKLNKANAKNLTKVIKNKKSKYEKYHGVSKVIWNNITPAKVCTLTYPESLAD